MCLINNQVRLITQVYAVSVKISMLSIVKLQFLAIILAMCMTLFKDTWFAHLQQQCILYFYMIHITAYVLYMNLVNWISFTNTLLSQIQLIIFWFSFKKIYAATYCHGTTDLKVFHVIINKSDFPYSVIEWYWLVSNLLLVAKMLDDNKR